MAHLLLFGWAINQVFFFSFQKSAHNSPWAVNPMNKVCSKNICRSVNTPKITKLQFCQIFNLELGSVFG